MRQRDLTRRHLLCMPVFMHVPSRPHGHAGASPSGLNQHRRAREEGWWMEAEKRTDVSKLVCAASSPRVSGLPGARAGPQEVARHLETSALPTGLLKPNRVYVRPSVRRGGRLGLDARQRAVCRKSSPSAPSVPSITLLSVPSPQVVVCITTSLLVALEKPRG